MYQKWVRILRFNFSHFSYDDALKYLEIIKGVEKLVWWRFEYMLDTKWPDIRIWVWLKDNIFYQKWEEFKIVLDKKYKDKEKTLVCDYVWLIDDVNVWTLLRLDEWRFDVVVVKKDLDYILVECVNSAKLTQKKHLNVPWFDPKIPVISEQDEKDILFAIKNDFDWIALSFVEDRWNLEYLRQFLDVNGGKDIKIVSKIETQSAVDNIVDILSSSDMVMIARWDLWVETSFEEVPFIQKKIMFLCKKKWVPVIVATQILDSMIDAPVPTRAEISDIYLALERGADFLMLSWESAVGKYPLECVEIINNVKKAFVSN